jgi:hypothetical protein
VELVKHAIACCQVHSLRGEAEEGLGDEAVLYDVDEKKIGSSAGPA